MESFSEFGETGQVILALIDVMLKIIEIVFKVHFRQPRHDIGRRFLNEIVEFEPLKEE